MNYVIVKKIGSVMGLCSTIIGVIVAFLMMDLQSNQLEFISRPSVLIAVFSAFIISYLVGIIGARKIIIENKNFIFIWAWYGFITVICAEIAGFFVHIAFVNPSMERESLLFLFFIISFYAMFLVIFFGAFLGYVVKYLGEKFYKN